MLTSSTGAVTATFSYGAYGALTGKTGTATTPFGYAGQYTNLQSGLQYLRARVYDPATGQFLTRDPLEQVTHHPYTYADANPVNKSDPSGYIAVESEEEIICYWPFCPPPAPAVEYLEEELSAAANTLAGVWNSITGSGDEDEADGPAPGQCPLAPPPAVPNFDDPTQPPGVGWEWRGNGPAGTKEGAWHNPETEESLHPDLGHGDPHGPHYDWKTPDGKFRVYPDGKVEPKNG
jgi:RHS repeat-associated protein